MASKGEKKVAQILIQLHISYIQQHKIPFIKKRTYDFMFVWNQQPYIIEVDGLQHFQNIEHFKSTAQEQHINDLMKQILALFYGYKVIRIHYNDINSFYDHLVRAIQHLSNAQVYYSNPSQYNWMYEIYITCILTQKGTIRRNYIKRYVKKRYVADIDRFIPLPYQ
jgi:very-short-patch-repair endonuclease